MEKIDPFLIEFLDEKADLYEQYEFITNDPISIPHLFSKKEDIEIAGFLTATIAWGKRVSIIKNAKQMIEIMENAPYDFILNHTEIDLKRCVGFVHRTFNAEDFVFFIKALKKIYLHHGGLEQVFTLKNSSTNAKDMISNMRSVFFEGIDKTRTMKHVSNPIKGSAAKRINMYLRWMVRDNNRGVDFNIWKSISPSQLSIPLDVHTGNIARQLGLLSRKQNDLKAVEELDDKLRLMNKKDPVKYDFALFGIGVNGDLDKLKLMV